MIGKLSVFISSCTDPYENLAREEFLTFHAEPGECILYLWQNAHTVVIGRNQNCWKECRVAELEESGGRLARRLSGGGAVYHDMGNLNFTFCMKKEEADVSKQASVIRRAAASFGLDARLTGRNDVTIDGRKFSGNAFFDSKGCYYHHGTLLLYTDTSLMTKYLRPSAAKLASKGVDSVRSRVVNLQELCPQITVEAMKEAMTEAFSAEYGHPVGAFDGKRFDEAEIRRLAARFGSWEWKYGRRIPFTHQSGRRFAWGEAELSLKVNGGVIEEAVFATDSMEADWFDGIGPRLAGCRYDGKALSETVDAVLKERKVPENVRTELREWIISTAG